MVDFFSRPDTKYLINNLGCAPSEAFSILERGGNPSNKCGGRLTGNRSVTDIRRNFPGFDAAFVQTLELIQQEQQQQIQPAQEPIQEPTPAIEPVPSPIIDSSPAQTVKKKKSRLDLIKERTAKRRGKSIEARFGFSGIVKQPTTFLVGEAGPERVKITPIKRMKTVRDFDFANPRKSSKRRRNNSFMFDFDFGKGIF